MSAAPEEPPVIGITAGDLNGIGLEVIIKTLSEPGILELCTPVVLANAKVASYHRNAIERRDFNFHIVPEMDKIQAGKPNLLNCWEEEVNLSLGEENPEVGAFAVRMLDAAIPHLKSGALQGLVTAPIHKKSIQSAHFQFTGHTDYLEERFGARATMLMISEEMRMALTTVHVPLAAVTALITQERVYQKIADLHDIMQRDFHLSKPRIAVLALNPHAGDHGVMGDEDRQQVAPAIKQAFAEGYLAFGPYPADGFFGSARHRQFDVVLAQYHDQGLVPFKASSFGTGVNVTAGLPIIRTSPDHGTAFDLAGQGIASPDSFRQALYTAIDLVKRRSQSDDDRSNPLKVKQKNSKKDKPHR